VRTVVAVAAMLLVAPPAVRSEASRAAVTRVGRTSSPGELIVSAQAVRQLGRDRASEHLPVRITGVVTYYDPDWNLLFVNDDTAGVFVFPHDHVLRVTAGDRVVVEGLAVPGDFAPSIADGRVTLVGRGPLPEALVPTPDLLRTGRYDSQRVVLEGVVRALRFPVQNGHLMLDVLVDGQRVLAQVPGLWHGALPERLVDARVRIRGVCGSQFGQQRQFVGIQMFLPSLGDVEIVEPATDVRQLPRQSIETLLKFASFAGTERRIRIHGVVTFRQGPRLYVQEGPSGVRVQLAHPEEVAIGSTIDLAGFPATGGYGAVLEDAAVVEVGGKGAIRPVVSSPADLAIGSLDGELVTVEARLIDRAFTPEAQVLVLLSNGRSFTAHLAGSAAAWPSPPEPGSRVTVTGVSEAEINRDIDPLHATSFRLLLRSPADVLVTEAPSWWTLGHSVAMGLGLAVLGLAAAVWVVVLRRQVAAQTRTLEERLQQELELQARYRDLFENANDVVCTWDVQGRLTSINRAGEQLTGYTRSDTQSMFITDLVAPEHGQIVKAALSRSLLSRRSTTFEVDLVTRSGMRVTLEFDTRPVERGGTPAGVQAIGRDVTWRKRTQAELQRARDAAEAASRAKSQFVANVSHEVRTPMNGILGLTELLLEGPLSDEQRQYLGMVKASADALLHVINDVLDFSRIEAGRLELHPVAFDLRDQLADILQPLAVAARKKGLHLGCRVAPDVPARVLADGERLRQVLLNICGNALKFTADGEVTMDVRLTPDLASGADRTMLEFRIRDTGIGIPPEKHDLVFGAFTQADGSTSRRFGGTGLGLAISASLVRLMGGAIALRSAEGEGSTFTITVPAVAPVDQPARDWLPAGAIVVIDPNAASREALAERLQAWGARTACGAGMSDLEAAIAGGPADSVNAIVVAAEAIGADAAAVGARVRALAPTAAIIATALAAQPADVKAARALGVSSMLPRPLRESALLSALRSAATPAPAAVDAALRAAVVGRSVLLAEDNPVNQRLAVHVLERRGHTVRVAENGREVLAMLEDWRPDLVLMDVQMPEMNGLEATAAIRELELKSGDHLPIVAMTAHAMEGDRERCLQAGMDDYLTKPISASALIQAVERIVDSFESPTYPRREAAPEPRPEMQPVDRDAAMKRVDGDAELLGEIVDLFLADVDNLTNDIRNAVQAADAGQVMRTAHRLKGSVATLAAEPAADAALRLEIMGRNDDLAGAEAALDVLERELKRLVPALRSFVHDAAA